MKPTTDVSFKIPGKTFLVGEYAVLLEGPSLGIATAPCFEFTIGGEKTLFHQDSPAGKYLSAQGAESEINFRDPYKELNILGGFGRSTAEYLAVLTPELLKRKYGIFEILKGYKELHSAQKIKPSGMDLVFQFFGGVTMADQKNQLFQNFEWNFLNLDFCLLYSGIKVQTHDHLAALDLSRLEELPKLSSMICNLFAKNNEEEFLYLMGQWCDLLQSYQLTHPHSLELRNQLESTGLIKLAKPCGALGADVLALFFDRSDRNQVRNWLDERKFIYVAGADDLSSGLVSQLRPYWSQNVG